MKTENYFGPLAAKFGAWIKRAHRVEEITISELNLPGAGG